MTTAQEDATLKRACCSTWTNPVARLLLGERLHPGGEGTTLRTVDSLALKPGARVLDLGCGYGSALAILARHSYDAIGLDLAREAATSASASGYVVVADAEHPPVKDGSFDGIVMECVLSLLPDKQEAMSRARSALKEGGRIAISDVTIERPLSPAVGDITAWSMCVAGALPAEGYTGLLRDAGFAEAESISLDDELLALVQQIRRRLSLIEVALTVAKVDLASLGLDRDGLEALRGLATVALGLVRSGGAGYRLFHATKR